MAYCCISCSVINLQAFYLIVFLPVKSQSEDVFDVRVPLYNNLLVVLDMGEKLYQLCLFLFLRIPAYVSICVFSPQVSVSSRKQSLAVFLL
ncbi:CDP-diacylglycerol--inositol 3-phosphatidyltransferase 1 [Bienertia sinuspersici]